ncbi:hypothetical protein [Stappia indica]|uniref:Secreted protein n=1 Tax=Stappia indica TaxID=538381 RepID=A0A857C6F6_9HYPH|nr:hypothetical protein [Stappia indica]QGZ34616.1 hypothetical protein GH266_08895 [Stappia indica]
MSCKFLIAASLSLGLATGAVAQTAPQTGTDPAAAGTSTSSGLPMGWDGAIGDAFFSDPQTGTLRPETEVRSNWDTLTSDQQARVRSHCASVDTASSATTTPGAGSDVTGSTGSAGGQAPAGTALPTAKSDHTASIQQACGWIKE